MDEPVFDLQKDTYETLLSELDKGNVSFRIKDGNNYAHGDGAQRQMYNSCLSQMFKVGILMCIGIFFMDINEKHKFWEDEKQPYRFARFLRFYNRAGCILPYHLHPALLSNAMCDMSFSDLEFYMEKMYPDIFNSAKKVLPENFEALGTDYETHKDLYKSTIYNQSNEKKKISGMIAYDLGLLFCFGYLHNIMERDRLLSGVYTITPDMALGMMEIISAAYYTEDYTEDYTEEWKKFVRSLTEEEIKQMLLTLGNTISTEAKYRIYITDMKQDIQIQTCFYTVSIRKQLFDDAEKLMILKDYLTGKDQIYDKPREPLQESPLTRFLSNEPPINVTFNVALLTAARNGNLDIVQFLLNQRTPSE